MWGIGNCILHHGNVPAHLCYKVREYLTQKNIPTLPDPPFSPNLAPCDFFLFPKIKNHRKGRRFYFISDIRINARRELILLKKSDFLHCFFKMEITLG